MDMWEAFEEHDEVVYIPMTSGLSTSCHSAVMLAEEYDGRVHVVDNKRISVTQMQSVFDACKMAEQGMTGSQIKQRLEEEALDATIYIAVDTLEYLKKGGRVTAAGAAIGSVLNIKPVLTIQGDKLDAYAKVRGMKTAFRTMCKALHNDVSTRLKELYDSHQLMFGIANTAMEPEVLVLDEPTSQLDPQGSEEVFRVVDRLAGSGITIIMVEHKMEKLAAYCSRLLLLHEGKQVAYDSPEHIFAREDLEAFGIEPPVYTQAARVFSVKYGDCYPVTLDQTQAVRGTVSGKAVPHSQKG